MLPLGVIAMRNYWNVLFFLGLQLLSVSSYAQQINVNSLRYTTSSKQNRMMFDVTASPIHRVFVMDNPSRLVIDIKDARLERALSQPSAKHPLFSSVRSGTKNDTDLRIVVDLKTPVSSKKFSLKSNNSDAHRLVIDLFNKDPMYYAQFQAATSSPYNAPCCDTCKYYWVTHEDRDK